MFGEQHALLFCLRKVQKTFVRNLIRLIALRFSIYSSEKDALVLLTIEMTILHCYLVLHGFS